MHILMISDVYFPRINGVSTSISILRRELEALGHETALVMPHYGGDRRIRFDADSATWCVPARKVPLDPEDRLFRAGALRQCLAEIDVSQVDIVHVHTPFAAHRQATRWARRKGLPVVETCHTFFEEYFYHYIPLVPRQLLRTAARSLTVNQCRALDAMVVPSHPMLDVLRGYGVDCPAEVIPTGIEPGTFRQGDGGAFRRACGIPAERPVLIHIGRVAFEKNIGFLLHVLREVRKAVPEVLLVIAGEGPARSALAKQVKDLALEDNVLFVGYLDRETELVNCYHAGDLFVFSSRTETQGLVLLEAMAAGLPVVSTAVMGTRDVLVDGQGCRVAEEDVGDFAGVVTSLLRDAGARAALARSAQAWAERWSAAAMAHRMVDFYEDVVSIYHDSPEPGSFFGV